MCGRFAVTGDLDFYADYFDVGQVAAEPLRRSWNVAPTDRVYVVAEREGERTLQTMKWGLAPDWAKDSKDIHINARSETVASGPVFRDSFARRRCLIPADGFYEWGPAEKGRTPHWVYRADGRPMALAGVWAARKGADEEEWRRGCSVITAPADGVVARIHDRMPVTLPPEAWGPWLDRALTGAEAALSLIGADDPETLMEHAVSKRVNSVRNDGPGLQDRAEPETLF